MEITIDKDKFDKIMNRFGIMTFVIGVFFGIGLTLIIIWT